MTEAMDRAATAYPVFYRTYSRKVNGNREHWHETSDRTLKGLQELGKLTQEQSDLIKEMQLGLKALTSGRWLWVGGTEWSKKQANHYGSYNCTSTLVVDWQAFGLMMNLAMQGCGTGAVLETQYIEQLPEIRNRLNVEIQGKVGDKPHFSRKEQTHILIDHHWNEVLIEVGDSREGWVKSYEGLLRLSSDKQFDPNFVINVTVDVTNVRPPGEILKGFGGVANPIKLEGLYSRCAEILNKAVGRKLNAVECCLLIDEAALVVVAGNVRRSAGMRQFSENDKLAEVAKDNLWQQSEDGSWRIDPERDALRMANHTRVFHHKPSLDECIASVTKQYYSGEGAIQYAPEAIARANADLLTTTAEKLQFLKLYEQGIDVAKHWLAEMFPSLTERELMHRLQRYGLNPCLTGDTLVLTSKGGERIRDLVGRTVTIFDGQNWIDVDNFRVTGYRKEVFKVTLSSGDSIKATPYHTFILENGTRKPLNELVIGEKLKDAFENSEHEFIVTSIEFYAQMEEVFCCTVPTTSSFALANGVLTGNCGEIIGSNFFCNLSEIHLNQIDPLDIESQRKAFAAGGLSVAVLLNHQFVDRRYQESREADPIVGVSFTGLFDFFVNAFGVDWLRWWEAGRPKGWDDVSDAGKAQIKSISDFDYNHAPCSFIYRDLEAAYLTRWKETATKAVTDYCLEHGLKAPNRCTTVQPSGCLTKDAIRVFDQGLFFADEHMESAIGDCDLQDYGLTVRDGVHVLAGIANEQRSLIRITLENGRQLTMTPDHRLSIGGQWVEASKMTVGQEVDCQIGNYRNANEALLDHVDLPPQGTGRPAKGCLLPDKMSPQLAYFIGALFGNGHISEHHYRLRFSHGSLAVLHRISEIGLELFGLEGVLTQETANKYELCFGNKQLYLWFLANGIEKPAKSRDLERIPVKLRQSSRQSLLAFFAGLIDTDGCIRKDGSLSIDSASELFIRHLQQVGEAVGLSFSVFANNQGQNWQDIKDMHGMCLSRMKSNLNSIEFLNRYSIKAKHRPIHPVKRTFSFNPYRIAIIETGIVDYTFDYTVESQDDDDAWYWQGALKSHNSKSLLTGASPGWHPPKAQRFIRRITFRKNDPVALACIDYGYSVVPSQSDKDENGHLLNDPFDPRCTEWLVEIPVEVPWANLEGADSIDISKFSALAQFDFYMQVQRCYTTHNTSSTIELRSDEIEPLATAIYETIRNDGGYISSALLARFDDLQTYPRMPFEPIDKDTYNRLFAEMLLRRRILDFHEALLTHDEGLAIAEAGPAGCDSDKCLIGGDNNK